MVESIMAGNKWGRSARAVEILLGLTFVASAALKALDVHSFAVQVSAYGVIREPALVMAAAYFTVFLETALGAALLAKWRLRGLTLATTCLLLAGFTCLIAYAWVFRGLEDCGCFGKYVKMGPRESILKNLVMMAMAGVAWGGRNVQAESVPGERKGLMRFATASVLIVLAALVYGHFTVATIPANPNGQDDPPIEDDRPFSQFRFEYDGVAWDLGYGEYFVALLSDTCDHCQKDVGLLNEMPARIPGLPRIVGLCLGEEETFQQFRELTVPEFPTVLIEPLTFMQLLDDAPAPPRYALVRDGEEIFHWNENLPEDDELFQAIDAFYAQ